MTVFLSKTFRYPYLTKDIKINVYTLGICSISNIHGDALNVRNSKDKNSFYNTTNLLPNTPDTVFSCLF